VVSFQVLEHVRDLGPYFAEARRVLKPDGRLLLSTHGVWLYHPHPEDHRRWTREGLIAEMAAHGFAVGECAAVAGPMAWTTVVRATGYCYGLRRLPLIGAPLAFALAAFMNSRAWLEDRLTPDWITRDNACVYVTLSNPVSAKA
jgi:SAM-dependent methyltransferase